MQDHFSLQKDSTEPCTMPTELEEVLINPGRTLSAPADIAQMIASRVSPPWQYPDTTDW